MEPPASLGAVSRSHFTATASHENARLERAFDDNLDTKWQSGHEQNGAEWIEMRFDRHRNIGLVRFEMGAEGSITDYPRHGLIESSDDGQQFRELYNGDVLTQLFSGACARRRPDPDRDHPSRQ